MTEVAHRKPGLLTRVAYGIGGAAGGIKNNGFEYVLLLFTGALGWGWANGLILGMGRNMSTGMGNLNNKNQNQAGQKPS